jgi:hypothetical protein
MLRSLIARYQRFGETLCFNLQAICRKFFFRNAGIRLPGYMVSQVETWHYNRASPSKPEVDFNQGK